MGHAFDIGATLVGAMETTRLSETLSNKIEYLNSLVQNPKRAVTDYERKHVDVVNSFADGNFKQAIVGLENIITHYPECVYSLKLAQDLYFYLGQGPAMRSSVSSALPQITRANPFKGYVHGMYSFALEESNQYEPAQHQAKLAISIVPHDTWAIHNYAHCLLMQGKTEDGIEWMYEKKPDWVKCSQLACHQFWHTSLFHILKGEYDQVLEFLDTEILPRGIKSTSILDVVDASSLIYRMELNDIFAKATDQIKTTKDEIKKRWKSISDTVSRHHTQDHIVGFNDCHYLMTFLGADDFDCVNELISTAEKAPKLVERDTVVVPLMKAMVAYKKEDYKTTIDYLFPIRHDIVRIGGSHAQRDVFEQLLLAACLKSEKSEHKKLAERLAYERKYCIDPTFSTTNHFAQSTI